MKRTATQDLAIQNSYRRMSAHHTTIKITSEFRNLSVTLLRPQQGCICHESLICG